MSERYRLVFRGEVLDGQHRAVVKKRLGQLLRIEGEKLDGLFSDRAVVIRRDADGVSAAKVQAAFQQAGARLRVVPLTEAKPEPPATDAATHAAATTPAGFTLRPMAGDLLDDGERRARPPVLVDVSHLTIAAPGVDLGPRSAPVAPLIDVDRVHFDVAPAGSDLGQKPREAAPPAPDTSHLGLR